MKDVKADFHFRSPYYILYNIHVDNILLKFIVLDMDYPPVRVIYSGDK